MTHLIFVELHRNARRLGLVAVSGFMSGILLYAHVDLRLFGWPAPVVIGLVYAGTTTAAAAFVCIALPGIRTMVESVAIARLLIATLAFAHPALAEALVTSPPLMAGLVVTIGYGVSRSLHGRIARAPVAPDAPPRFAMFDRAPLRLDAADWQRSFVGWIDGRAPVIA